MINKFYVNPEPTSFADDMSRGERPTIEQAAGRYKDGRCVDVYMDGQLLRGQVPLAHARQMFDLDGGDVYAMFYLGKDSQSQNVTLKAHIKGVKASSATRTGRSVYQVEVNICGEAIGARSYESVSAAIRELDAYEYEDAIRAGLRRSKSWRNDEAGVWLTYDAPALSDA